MLRKLKNKGFIFPLLILCLSVLWIPSDVQGKTSGKSPSDFANIVLFAHFSGDRADDDARWFRENRDSIIKYYNGTHGRSFTNYMKSISYNQFVVHNLFPQDTGTTLLSHKLSFSESDARDYAKDSSIIQEVMDANADSLKGKVIDYDGDGIIDNVTVILKCSSSDSITSHKSDYGGLATWQNKRVGTYNILNSQVLSSSESGLIAHEFLHVLGYPDLYTTSRYPVFTWDIMGSVTSRPQYPLAYLRMHFSKWIDIPEITDSQTITLHPQQNAQGNQAYIIKSPLNDQEFFVAEFRKKPTDYGEDSLDRSLGGSGIIVYRINPNVEQLSNHFNETGVYVFRPQKGQNGYYEDERTTVHSSAFLSKESGRTSIGSSDLQKTLEDGALTFSDGKNSGIVISSVSESSKDSMTCKISIPDRTSVDAWTNLDFPDTSLSDAKNSAGVLYQNQPCLTVNNNQKVQTYLYNGKQWNSLGSQFQDSIQANSFKMICHDDTLYLGYINSKTYHIVLKRFDKKTGTWKHLGSLGNNVYAGDGFQMSFFQDDLYVVYGTDSNARLARFQGHSLVDLGSYSTGNMLGQPQICAVGDQLYVSVRNALNNHIEIYHYRGANDFKRITDSSIRSTSYSLAPSGSKLYLALGGETLKMCSYDGTRWTFGKSFSAGHSQPTLYSDHGLLYIAASPSSDQAYSQLYYYSTSQDSYSREGVSLDTHTNSLNLAISDRTLYAFYLQGSKKQVIVKKKAVTDKPKEDQPTITPPETEKPSIVPPKPVQPTLCPSGRHSFQITVNKASLSKNGSIIKKCRICGKSELSVISAPKTIRLSASAFSYNQKTRTPSVIVKDSQNKTIASSNYTTAYANGRKAVGNYTVKLTFKGHYSGVKILSFSILPRGTSITKLKSGKKKITVKWKKQSSQTTGYQIQSSVSRNFQKSLKSVSISKRTCVSKTISRLKNRKKYYIRIRTFKTVKAQGKTIKLYSKWSKPKAVKTKK